MLRRPLYKSFAVAACSIVAAALVFSAGYAIGQANIPTENKGVKSEALRSIDLAAEIEGLGNRPLRMRKITVEPGGILGLHTHQDRPAVNYFLQGAITYHQDGKPDVTLSVGDGIAEGKDTTHWGENRGSVAAVFLAIDIPK